MVIIYKQLLKYSFTMYVRLRGATVARLTPDQKVACSNHVGVKASTFYKPFDHWAQFIVVLVWCKYRVCYYGLNPQRPWNICLCWTYIIKYATIDQHYIDIGTTPLVSWGCQLLYFLHHHLLYFTQSYFTLIFPQYYFHVSLLSITQAQHHPLA